MKKILLTLIALSIFTNYIGCCRITTKCTATDAFYNCFKSREFWKFCDQVVTIKSSRGKKRLFWHFD